MGAKARATPSRQRHHAAVEAGALQLRGGLLGGLARREGPRAKAREIPGGRVEPLGVVGHAGGGELPAGLRELRVVPEGAHLDGEALEFRAPRGRRSRRLPGRRGRLGRGRLELGRLGLDRLARARPSAALRGVGGSAFGGRLRGLRLRGLGAATGSGDFVTGGSGAAPSLGGMDSIGSTRSRRGSGSSTIGTKTTASRASTTAPIRRCLPLRRTSTCSAVGSFDMAVGVHRVALAGLPRR